MVVIVVDTLRADHLHCYGYSRLTSPNLDILASQGVLFENAIAPASWTQPSHASMLTGLYSHDHHAELEPLASRYPTIAEAMLRQGYRTGAFSANVNYFSRIEGFGRGFLRFEDYIGGIPDLFYRTVLSHAIDRWVVKPLTPGRDPRRRRAEGINAALLAWIDHDRTKPFFAFLNYFDVHGPYLPPVRFRGRFGNVPLERGYGARGSDRGRDRSRRVDAYDDCIPYADECIGELFRQLQDHGLADNTLFIVASDHGEQFGVHGFGGHGNCLYRQLIRVPLIMRWPGHVPAGVRVARPVSLKDLAATLLDLVGARDKAALPGLSLARLWQDPAAAANWPYPVSELDHFPQHPSNLPSSKCSMKSLVTPDWHLIMYQTLPPELYDWKRDPQELHNLAGQKATQPEIERLEAELQKLAPGWL